MVTNAETKIISVNQAFTDITGYTEEEAVGKTPRVLLWSGLQDEAFYKALWHSINTDGVWKGEIWNRKKSGEIYPQWETISVVKAEDGSVINYMAAFSDITPLKVSHERLEYLAHHDPLTGLPNRLLFNARFELSLQNAKRKHCTLALLFIDLDGFKEVNDSLGHHAGDDLLQQVASRLSGQVRAEDTVSRIGGDEFAIVLFDVGSEEHTRNVANKLLENVGKPYFLESQLITISCSIGISLYPSFYSNTKELMQAADAAMYTAKGKGKNCITYSAGKP